MYLQEKVNEYYLGASIYEAMEVWSLPKNKKHMLEEVCGNGKYFAQIKKDGNWYQYSKSTTGVAYLFSRGESTKTGLPVECMDKVPHIRKAFECLPNDTVLVGEIYYPGQTTNEVRSIMACISKKAVDRQKEKGNIHFYLHDIIRFDGVDITDMKAYDRYQKLVEVVNQYNLLSNEIELAEIIEENIYDACCAALSNGEEGAVLKLRTAPYYEGKKPAWSMIKVKERDTADVVCMGFNDATINYNGKEIETWQYWVNPDSGEKYPIGAYYDKFITEEECMFYAPVTKPHYHGWKTAIRLGVYKNEELIEIGTVSSGLSDDLCIQITNTPEDYIGKVVECECMQKTGGTLRHPRFIRFRDDKNARSCTFESIFN